MCRQTEYAAIVKSEIFQVALHFLKGRCFLDVISLKLALKSCGVACMYL